MEYKDYYLVMGLDKQASQDEIKRAYRKLSRKFHPDVSKEENAEDRFKEVVEAYEVLKDPEKRIAYDQLGVNYERGQEFQPPPNWDAGFEFSGHQSAGDSAAFSDFFESLFGRENRGGFHPASEDHHAKILINLEDAFHGCTRAITLQSPEIDAQGQVKVRNRTLKVKIPAGVRQGQQIRLAGQGQSALGKGNVAGDLYLEIEFKPHALYKLEGNDLAIEVPLTPWEAALGGKVKIPTPQGTVDLAIPAGVTSGKRLRLKGRGIPPGDLYAVLRIALPAADNDRAKAIYRNMEKELNFNPREKLGV